MSTPHLLILHAFIVRNVHAVLKSGWGPIHRPPMGLDLGRKSKLKRSPAHFNHNIYYISEH